jgi:prostaglandin-endoperoxide synthase 2
LLSRRNTPALKSNRRAMGLKPAKSFKDVVGNGSGKADKARRAALADELTQLYGTVDNLEFYIGLFAEPIDKNGPLPELIMSMVAMDAFSQALTNPLLSEHIWGDPEIRGFAFTKDGLAELEATTSLRQILARNPVGVGTQFVGMTRGDWKRR